jgi:hypothetical protein
VIVEPNYPSHRIEVNAIEADGRWNAEVRMRHHGERKNPSLPVLKRLAKALDVPVTELLE